MLYHNIRLSSELRSVCGMGGEVSSLFAVRVDLITPDHKANMPENVNNEYIVNT